MSTAQQTAPAVVASHLATRPRLLDYLLICVGAGLSAVLAEFSDLRASGPDSATPLVQILQKTLPFQLFLPLGILLFWPVFFTTQRLLGRQPGMTSGEWLWGLAWLGALALAVYFSWKGLGGLPELLTGPGLKQMVVTGYIVCVVALGALASLLTVLNVLTLWRPRPWTHTFGLVLLMWPLVPLAFMWLFNLKLE